MPTIPVIYLKDSPLSEDLKSFLNDLSSEVGRIIFFLDLNKSAPVDKRGATIGKVRAVSEPGRPYIVIETDMRHISRINYRPASHNALIAHEVLHPILWCRGYVPLSAKDQAEDLLYWIKSVNNWLSDPLINAELIRRGFDISEERTNEIRRSIKSVNKGFWTTKPLIELLQLAVSFFLEPNIPHEVRLDFGLALKRKFGVIPYNEIDVIVKKIKSLDLSTPKKYQESALLLMDFLSVKYKLIFNPFIFDGPFLPFSDGEIAKWVKKEIIETEPWP